MTRMVVLAALALSCGGEKIETPEQCREAGGRFVPSPGTRVSCAPGEEQIAAIPFGIEGAICCRAGDRSPGR